MTRQGWFAPRTHTDAQSQLSEMVEDSLHTALEQLKTHNQR